MNENMTAKRPIRKSAVVGIVIWSVVFCLLAGLLFAGLNGVGFRILDLNGFPVISFGGFSFEDAASYHVGDTTIADTSITDLSINWLAGDIAVIASDTDEIRIAEDYSGANDDLRLRWKVEEGKLMIQFRKPVLFGGSDSLKKDLTVAIPAAMLEAMDEVEINAVSADVHYTGNADELTLDTVEGNLTVNGDIGDMELNAVEGRVDFRGAVRRAEVSGVDTTVVMRLDKAAELTFDQVNADVTLYLAETVTGFNAELDSVGGEIAVEGFDSMSESGNKSARWGDGSLRITVDGVNARLEIKKAAKD